MIIVYILIALLLIAAAVYWVRLERNNVKEEIADKVEPDLKDLFIDGESAEGVEMKEPSVENLTFEEMPGIDHDDLSYRPKGDDRGDNLARESVVRTEAVSADAAVEGSDPIESRQSIGNEGDNKSGNESTEPTFVADEEMVIDAPLRQDDEAPKSGFLQKVSDFFRGNRAELDDYSDDGNLMRPAAVETVALILSAAPDQPYTFKEILTVAHELDLRVENGGFIQLLTTTHYGDEPMYSIGHLLGEGVFDEELVRHHLDDTTPGLIFFSKIPGPDPDISTIEQLLAGIYHFNSALGGTILDTHQRPMSREDLIELFHKVNKLDNEEWERAYEAYEQRRR